LVFFEFENPEVRYAGARTVSTDFASPGMPTLPSEVRVYKRSRLFTPETLPQALQQDHSTKAGVWGRIVVETGAVLYTRKGYPPYALRPGSFGAILPQELHSVTFIEDGAFYVEFLQVP
jgi:tellurite resistance-related uncharacterized protein